MSTERTHFHGGGERRPAVTIDGPAGSGKSTTARRVAEILGYRYLDSGALYRAIAWKALEAGVDPEDSESLGDLGRKTDLRVREVEGVLRVQVDGRDITEDIRRTDVTKAASSIALDPGVREALTEVQRELAAEGGVVLEGRDSGTVVLPDAEIKIYLTASVGARAGRRHRELANAGVGISQEEVEKDLNARDAQDSNREHSPLRKPEGAVEVDTTHLTIDEQVDAVVRHVRSVEAEMTSKVNRRGTPDGISSMRPVYRFAWKLLNILGSLLVGRRVLGRSRVPFPTGCIVASNHVSFWDPPMVGAAIPREMHYLAKRELFRNPLFRWLILSYNAVPINRDGIDRKGLKGAQDLLRSGEALLMFPEGARQKSGVLGKPMAGVGALAIGAGVPIVPAYISGTRGFRANLFRRGRLCVSFADPVFPKSAGGSAGRSAAARELTERVMEAIAGLRAELECAPHRRQPESPP